jgi:hypothetical protein
VCCMFDCCCMSQCCCCCKCHCCCSPSRPICSSAGALGFKSCKQRKATDKDTSRSVSCKHTTRKYAASSDMACACR